MVAETSELLCRSWGWCVQSDHNQLFTYVANQSGLNKLRTVTKQRHSNDVLSLCGCWRPPKWTLIVGYRVLSALSSPAGFHPPPSWYQRTVYPTCFSQLRAPPLQTLSNWANVQQRKTVIAYWDVSTPTNRSVFQVLKTTYQSWINHTYILTNTQSF